MNERDNKAELPADNRLALRRVARASRKAALATSLATDQGGRPYVSLVTLAFDHDLTPILLLSGLADHTRNLRAEPKAALLLDGTEGHANPQTGPRVTLVGTAEETDDPRLKARFLARHPAAALYAGFADFSIWTLRLERAHFVGGFARAVWFDAPLVPLADSQAMAAAEPGLLERLAAEGGLPWQVTGLDMDGCDVLSEERHHRVVFDPPAATPEQAFAAVLAATNAPLI
ncbi:heme iron utilization protein [Paramagnetospirillum kuznetsovii]|uniref:Heme iron utilization protein n=1 Tax=Paramagnetospirillum kuznetsovii TaxID=2053833 RepID=A0A364P1Y2_9PROT|nr:pyridoxamine 5'-phosphate oxidase family protein [Paramagnetospirillum kuznetsovii]RAU23349.1 heme iron utilization protein [Paramagnetospirillum kuznetsovii]